MNFYRFLLIYKPLLTMRINMVRYAKITFVLVTIVGLIISTPRMIFFQPELNTETGEWEMVYILHDGNPSESRNNSIMDAVIIVMFQVIPLFMMTIPVNTVNIFLLSMRRKEKVSKNSTTKSDSSTIMLVSVVVVFTFLKIPNCIVVMASATNAHLDPTFRWYTGELGRMTSVINSSVNFVIYFMVGPTFRRQLKLLLCGQKKNN